MAYQDSTVTTDLSDFGMRELAKAADLLQAYAQEGKKPEDFEADGVTVAMNRNSGYVFLTNAEYQVAMMNGDKLESFYSCPEDGEEGFAEDLARDGNDCCRAYLREIGAIPSDESEQC